MAIITFATYLAVTITSIIVNVVPAFAPPTWLVLSLYKINHPQIDLLALAFFGVVGSVIGRYVMYRYSELFGKYIPKKEVENLRYFRKFIGETNPRVFIETLVFSMSPLPSNFLFIAFGLSEVNIQPVLVGFFLGRLLSYTFLIQASFKSFTYFSNYFGAGETRIIIDLLGVLFAVIVIFIRWKKVYISTEGVKKKLSKFFGSK